MKILRTLAAAVLAAVSVSGLHAVPTNVQKVGGGDDTLTAAIQFASGQLKVSDATAAASARTNLIASQWLAPTAVKTASTYSVAAGDFVPCDTTSNAITLTLPTAPTDKTRVGVKLVIIGGANAVTINCGGSDVFNKSGGSTSATISLVNQSIILQYATGSPGIWYVVSTDLPLSGTDARYSPYSVTVNSQSGAYGLLITDANSCIYHPSADTSARTWTIPANASVAYAVGATITFFNDTSAGTITLAITSDTLVLAGAGTTGSVSILAGHFASALKVTSTRWVLNLN